MRLDLFIWSTFITTLFSCGMVLLTIFSRPVSKLKWLWILACLSVSFWSGGLCVMAATSSPVIAYRGSLMLTSGAIFIPVFLWHMAHTLLNRTETTTLQLFYGSALILQVLLFSGALMDVRPFDYFPFYTRAKPLYWLFMIHLYGGFLVLELSLWRAARKATPLLRKQIMTILWGTTAGFIGGQMCIGICYEIHIFPWGVLLAPIYVLSVGYGMFRYQLMEFRSTFRQLGLTLLIYACVAAALAPVSWPLVRNLLSLPPDLRWNVMSSVIVLTALISSGPLIYAVITRKKYWFHGHSTIGLVHEMKSPLSGIAGASQIMRAHLSGKEGPQMSLLPYVEMVEKNAHRLAEHVGDLLRLASSQEGRVQLHQTTFRMSELIVSVVEAMQPLAHQKGLTIVVEAEADIQVYADRAKIGQVFSNLLSNAIKFSDRGQITVTAARKGQQIECSVQDEGPGIPDEDVPHIFERFYQGKNASKGSGIGLSIAKAWVEAHGGRIWVTMPSSRGAGIVFRFS